MDAGSNEKVYSFFRQLTLLNLLLIAVIIFMADYSIRPYFDVTFGPMLPSPHIPAEIDTVTTHEYNTPSLSDYILVAEDNLFHPERKIPVEKKAEATPLPKPDFLLYGTLISDDLRVAYLEDLKAPHSSTGRGRRQIPVRQGDVLSGFTLREVSSDKVLMVRGEESITIKVHENRSKKETPTPAAIGIPGKASQGAQTSLPQQKAPQPVGTPERTQATPSSLQQSTSTGLPLPYTHADQRILDALDRRQKK